MSGRGLGTLLIRRMIYHCRRRGIGEVHGDVLRENAGMLGICKKLGFTAMPLPEEPSIMRVTLRLATGMRRVRSCGSPLLQTTFGVEYLHTRRVLESGEGGDLDRVEFSAISTFRGASARGWRATLTRSGSTGLPSV